MPIKNDKFKKNRRYYFGHFNERPHLLQDLDILWLWHTRTAVNPVSNCLVNWADTIGDIVVHISEAGLSQVTGCILVRRKILLLNCFASLITQRSLFIIGRRVYLQRPTYGRVWQRRQWSGRLGGLWRYHAIPVPVGRNEIILIYYGKWIMKSNSKCVYIRISVRYST